MAKIRCLAAALSLVTASGTICAFYSNTTDGSVGFGRVDNVTGQLDAGTALQITSASELGTASPAGPDSNGWVNYLHFSSNATAMKLLRGVNVRDWSQRGPVVVQPPAGYAGSEWGVSGLALDPQGAVVALLVSVSTKWAVLAAINPIDGSSQAVMDLTNQYFRGAYPFKDGLFAVDWKGSHWPGPWWWLVATGSWGDLGVGFNLTEPTAPMLIAPFSAASNVTSLQSGIPTFNGTGLVALAIQEAPSDPNPPPIPPVGTLNLWGSIDYRPQPQPYWIELQNYNSSFVAAQGSRQLVLSPDASIAHVGLQSMDGGRFIVSTVDLRTLRETGAVTTQGFSVLSLVYC